MIVACFVRVFCEKKSSQFTFNVHSCWSFNGRRYATGDFINLDDLSAQSSKMLIEIGLHACIHRMSVLVFVLLCFAKENHSC